MQGIAIGTVALLQVHLFDRFGVRVASESVWDVVAGLMGLGFTVAMVLYFVIGH